MNLQNLAIVILAAGQGKRMNNPELPKVLTLLNEKPLLEYVLELSSEIYANPIVVIVGHRKEKVIDFVENYKAKKSLESVHCCVQYEQLGTGHAVQQAEDILKNFGGNILILSGDVPMLSSATIRKFIEMHSESESDLSVLTARAINPFGYGRIVRDRQNIFLKITEERDADICTKEINEINSGIYLVKKTILFDSLQKVQNENAQSEFYLTDIIEICIKSGYRVNAFKIASFDEIQGVNSLNDLEKLKNFRG